MRPRSTRLRIALLISAILIVAGVVIVVVGSPSSTASFGWFAYQPLAGATYVPSGFTLTTPLTSAALAMIVVGLIGLSGSVGFLLGRRARPDDRAPE